MTRPAVLPSVTIAPMPAATGSGWYMVVLLMLVQTVSYIDRFLPSLLTPAIKADLHLSDFQLGLLLGPAFALFYVAVGLPFGWAADRLSRRGVLTFGIAVWSAMTSAASLAGGFGPLFAARLGVGFGEAAVAPCAVSLISDRFEAGRRPRAISVYMAGSFIGAGLAFLVGGPVVRAIEKAAPLIPGMRPWQSAFMVAGLPGLLLALLMFTFAEPVRREVTRGTGATVSAALAFIVRHGRAFGALFVGSACVVTLGSLSLWNVALFQRTWGWNVGQVGVATGVLYLTAGPVGTVLGVQLTQWWIRQGRRDATLRTLVAGLLVGAPGFALFPLAPDVWVGLLGMFVGFVGQAAATAAGPAALSVLAPGQIRAKATSIYYLVVSVAGQLLGPPPVGWLVDRMGDPARLRYAVSLEAAIVAAPAVTLVILGLGAFRRHVEALERETAEAARG